MYYYPSNDESFTREELVKIIENIDDDIFNREEYYKCDLLCLAGSDNIGLKIQIRKYRAMDGKDYRLYDLYPICPPSKINSCSSFAEQSGPIILPEKSVDSKKTIINILAKDILIIQDICADGALKFVMSSTISSDPYMDIAYNRDAVITGTIKDVKEPFNEVNNIITENTSRYLELNFTLDKPNITSTIYIYITRDTFLNIEVFMVNIKDDTIGLAMLYSREDLRVYLESLISNIYLGFKKRTKKAMVKVTYYSVSEREQLLL
jgi:hypothetical protein